jgi:hypothetical protein
MLKWCAASAASLLTGVGTGAWLFFSSNSAQGADDLLDHLVDWNLQLTEASTETERNRLYADRVEPFRSQLEGAKLPPEQKSLAKEILANGAWMVDHQDPVVEADRFDNLADRFLQLARTAGKRGNHRCMNRLLHQYNRLLESGIELNVLRAEMLNALDAEHQRKLERLGVRDPERMQVLTSLLETAPDASRKEIEHALGIYHKRRRRSHRRRHSGHKREASRGNGAGKRE